MRYRFAAGARFIASPRDIAREPCQRARTCGAPSGRNPSRDKGSLSAPRLCGAILMPMPRRLTAVSVPALLTLRRMRPGHSSPGGRELGPLRLVRYPARGLRPGVPSAACARTSGAAPPAPRADGLQLASSRTRDGWSVTQAPRVGIRIFTSSPPGLSRGSNSALARPHAPVLRLHPGQASARRPLSG